jgi:hypothetical protein
MERRKITFSEMDMEILANVFELSAGNRIWEKKSSYEIFGDTWPSGN